VSGAAHSGSIFVVAAPSGAGKTSLVQALMNARPDLRHSVSFTTRAPRPGEIHGRHYFFVDPPEFERRREAGEFLEWAQVHGNCYATSRRWIDEQVAGDVDIVLEIDWQGARQLKRQYPDAVGVFVLPPSIDELHARLLRRGQDSAEVVARRVAAARSEIAHADEFEFVIINQDFASAARDLIAVVDAARLRRVKQRARHTALFEAFAIPSIQTDLV
jgi:guanylate kinase